MVMAFGSWLRRRRRALDLTQAELAEQIGCTPISLRKIEAEERRPSAELAARLATRLGIAPEQHAAFIQFSRGDPWAGQVFDAPVPAGTLGPAAQLPAPLTPLIGRAREAATIRRQLRQGDCRLLSLLGPAGIGKTRLALAAAARLAAEGVFGGGVFFVALASTDDPQLFWPAIAQAVGLREAGQQPLREALGQALRQRPVLLVLDNLEQLLEATAGLPELLGQCPQLKILATSREPLRIYGEQRFMVPLLALPAAGQHPTPRELGRYSAIALFVARAQAVRPDFVLEAENALAVTGICARLDGLPLALELVAARMDRLSAMGLLAELDPSAPMAGREVPLHTDGLQGLPERQRTLYNALEWSYQRLPEFEQRLFVRLAAFAGGCTVEAAQTVCAESEPGVAAGLAALADKSLLRHEPGDTTPSDSESARTARYDMLVTVEAYARERLEAGDDAEAIQQRHADYFLRLAETAAPELAGPRQVEWLKRLDAEAANLQAALRYSLDRAAPEEALRLCIALFRFWQVRGSWTEARQWVGQALARAPAQVVEPVLRARALNIAGSLAGMQGDFVAADGFFSEGLELFRESGDRRGLMVMSGNLGLVARNQGNYGRAIALHQESLALARELDAVPNVAHALNNLGLVCNAQGELTQAERYLTEGLSLHRQVGNRHDIGATLQALGETQLRQNQTGAAEASFRESLQLRTELHDAPSVSGALAGLAAVAATLNQPERAARLIGAVERLREEIGTPMLPVDRVLYEHTLERLRPRQAEPGVAAAWDEGRRLTWEQAAACGLETGR